MNVEANANTGSYHAQQKEGFANVARWLSLDRDNEAFIYRRFNELSARNILYLQCELLDLEKKLNELDKKDVTSDDMDLKDVARTWETFIQRFEEGNSEAVVRMELITKLRAKIKEYHETLLLQGKVSNLKHPNKRALEAYRYWFNKPYPALGGVAKTALDNEDDLVALNTPPEKDHLSRLLRWYWPAKEEISRDGLHRIGRFNEASISTAVAIVNILVASFLLIGSIVGLYFATNDALKLALIAAFTALFALSIGLMTNARRAEIFAATAAYAAVLVVFVSGDISSSGSS
ncbi:hypothetical protein ASPSYDRAFT_29548 [Aspergillus sydowii CBS 593.65]|uniref:DUF6594 domain-containing protein n=1 Tax=Aspergillus sydowii CBS 593.65 TaxID=1036612 RepID=A0A1L9TNP0_9EURO|nr:uncharacterized protein ASPSYDRAFT_29548 [Aspergillus sydowii CBS 593.65]OJJ61040.1 hypothetical protein ASPSYDRAFT_29548 [Aspergillus sydowii CBS 593.65]